MPTVLSKSVYARSVRAPEKRIKVVEGRVTMAGKTFYVRKAPVDKDELGLIDQSEMSSR
jgi:hypothetical protein